MIMNSEKRITPCMNLSERANEYIGFVSPYKNQILQYLNSIPSDAVITCSCTDYVTGETQKESIKHYRDGAYSWTNEEVYHIEKYDLKLSDDFVDYVLNKH